MSIWPLGRPGHKPERNIKTDLQEVELGIIHWIDLDQDRYGWWTFVNAVMYFRVTWTAGNWLADKRLASQEEFWFLRKRVRCQFECNFRSLSQQICFHLTQIRIQWCFPVSVMMTSICTKAVRFLYRTTKSWYHQVSRPMFKYLWLLWTELLIVRISVKDNWQSNICEKNWDFDLTIYLSVDITFLSTMVAQCFSFPLSNSAVTVSILALTTNRTCYLLPSERLNTFCITLF